MKVRILKNKILKSKSCNFYLAKGEVREAYPVNKGRCLIEADEKGSNIWFTLNKEDFKEFNEI